MTATDAALLAPSREVVLASFSLSRVTEAFFDDMLGVLPPAHITGVPGFFVTEAVSEDIHAQFVAAGGRFYGGYVGLRDRAGLITHARIAEFDTAHPDAVELAWYPDACEEAAR
ncbi:hypothetical protein [Novosphingobium pentaromativorans]|uniref:Uncharacterized protein n=1 Tax=Novosphingobium pentaromativorans US6-1 TaxID=1088721 RepID=G6EKV8_9SPHN|nr:hypothetical protein [Novosphingobium pentaromativorans]AIT82731.1 hypothetical protein JI59_25115 [Novosphingobium pentaromativorans US6-1]EHJ57925.1 hypothetical protein NSU_pLA1031 [Novosphingobium pentaromativorans US6-1]